MANQNEINVQVKATIGELQSALNKANQEMKQFFSETQEEAGKTQSILSGIGKTLIAYFSVREIKRFTESTIELASAFNDLSIQTQIPIEQLEKFKFLAGQTGTSLETITNSVLIFQKNLSSGKIDDVLKALKIDIDDIKNDSPDEQFLKISQALNKIENPTLKAAAAMALLGRGGKELLKIFNENPDVVKKAMNDASVATSEAVKKLDEYGDAWRGFIDNLKTDAIPVIVWILDKLKEIGKGMGLFGGDLDEDLQGAHNYINKKTNAPTQNLTGVPTNQNDLSKDVENALNKDAAKKAVEDAKLVQQELLRQKIDSLNIISDLEVQKALETNQELLDENKITNKEYLEQRIKLQDELDAIDLKAAQDRRDTYEQGTKEYEEAGNKILEMTKKQEIDKAKIKHLYNVEANKDMNRLAESINSSFQNSIASVIDGTKSLKDAFHDLAKSIISDLAQIAAKNIATSIFSGLGIASGTGASGMGGGLGGLISSVFGGFLAGGGGVDSNKGYIVGEDGPEYFAPGVSGTILNAGQMSKMASSGGVVTNISVNVNSTGSNTKANTNLGQELGRQFTDAVNNIIIQNQRPGGLLA